MDFRLTREQEALRNEFEAFCIEEAKRSPPPAIGYIPTEMTEEGWAYHRSVVDKLVKKGWLCLPWPKEFGGLGYGPVEQLIFNDVTAYHRVPAVPFHFMTVAAGIMQYGTDEQKKEWLPKIARAEICWAELLSEPDAGSDLASLKTSAVPDGDDYIINGHKIWQSRAHHANHVFILARTGSPESRHRGLTFFINPIGPGIEFRPLVYMNGSRVFFETTITNFRVPARNAIGGINQGWYVMMAGRNFARVNITTISEGKRDLEDLIEYCKQTRDGGVSLASKPLIRHKLVELMIDFEAARQSAYYVTWLQSKGKEVSAEVAACGYFAKELNLRMTETALEIMGLYGTVKGDSRWAPLYGKFQDLCQWALGHCIAGGTTEIRKNVVAWQGLGLPRS